MRTLNYLLTIVLLFLIGSCSKDTPVQDIENEELAAVEYKSRLYQNEEEEEEVQEVFELDLHQNYILGQIAKLNERKRRLEVEIEGGNENLIPALESVVKELHINHGILDGTLDLTCILLKLRYEILTQQVTEGNTKAIDELLRIKEALENCGIHVEDYLIKVFGGHPIMYAMSWGSRCNPGREWKCKKMMNEGKLLFNIEEELANRTTLRFKSVTGEEISTGRMVGNHGQLRDIAQFEIELRQIENGVIEISNENGKYEIPVEVR